MAITLPTTYDLIPSRCSAGRIFHLLGVEGIFLMWLWKGWRVQCQEEEMDENVRDIFDM